ncbi:MAG: PAS domain S-box protein, partial [Opitutaceae bacterium]
MDEQIACEFVYAASKAEFTAALAREKFDLILADLTMPGYDGTAALALVQAKCPEVPYLFVSGTMGEERAIESLKNGATDYVLKGRLERLLSAVRRALREAGESGRRRVAEDALRRAEARYRDIFENAVEGIYQSTPEGGLLDVNLTMARLCGYASPEDLREGVCDVARDLHVTPARRAEFVRLLDAHGEVLAFESQIRRKDGTVLWIFENARAVRGGQDGLYYESMVTDITARKASEEALRQSEEQRRQLETQLRQAQKMEAVGQLAGGLAHDFNNVLCIVIGYARLLLDSGTLPPDTIKPLNEIFTAGNRASNLTRQLLVFSSKQTLRRQPLDINQIAGEIADMLRRLIGEHIRLDLALSPKPCIADADAGMMEQVLMNLAVNARDA